MFCLSGCVQTEEESGGKVFRIHCDGPCIMSTGQHTPSPEEHSEPAGFSSDQQICTDRPFLSKPQAHNLQVWGDNYVNNLDTKESVWVTMRRFQRTVQVPRRKSPSGWGGARRASWRRWIRGKWGANKQGVETGSVPCVPGRWPSCWLEEKGHNSGRARRLGWNRRGGTLSASVQCGEFLADWGAVRRPCWILSGGRTLLERRFKDWQVAMRAALCSEDRGAEGSSWNLWL